MLHSRQGHACLTLISHSSLDLTQYYKAWIGVQALRTYSSVVLMPFLSYLHPLSPSTLLSLYICYLILLFLVCLLFELSFLNISQSTAVLCAHTTINTRDIYTYENYNIISVRLDKKGKEKEISSHL